VNEKCLKVVVCEEKEKKGMNWKVRRNKKE